MAKYSRALDLMTTSIRLAQKGKMPEAAKCFEHALKSKDLEATLATLETQQVAAFEAAKKANPTLASLFTEIAAKKKTAKKKVKAKPFGGKAAPPFKKKSKAKASEGEDEGEEESAIDDELDPVLDEMTAEDLVSDDGVEVVDGDDLSLEDLDGLLDDDSGIEEMPEANVTAGEGEDEGEEESSDDESDEKDGEEESSDDSEDEDEGEEESAPAQTAKVKTVASNLAALDRLRKSAGAKKPAK